MDSPGGRERRPRSSRRAPSRLSLHAETSDAGLALDAFCARRGGISLEDARAAIERGGAYVGRQRTRDAARAMRAGEVVTLHLLERGQAPAALALEPARLLYLDEHLLAVDKPAGVLAQEGLAGGPDLPSLATALLASLGERGPALLVHRLDRGTTGVTLLARTHEAQAALLESFREGRVEKEYLALCGGIPEEDRFEVDLALGPDDNLAGRRALDPNGQAARTRFQVLQRWPAATAPVATAPAATAPSAPAAIAVAAFGPASSRGASLVAAFPETGRTHQIRVHLSARGFALLGDARYDGPRFVTRADGQRLELARPMLHARAIAVPHPQSKGAREMLRVSAPEPADLSGAVAFLEGAAKR